MPLRATPAGHLAEYALDCECVPESSCVTVERLLERRARNIQEAFKSRMIGRPICVSDTSVLPLDQEVRYCWPDVTAIHGLGQCHVCAQGIALFIFLSCFFSY